MSDSLLLVGGTLWDGTGAAAQPDAAVLLAGGRVQAVGVAGSLCPPVGATVVDVTGRTLLPGLIEGHAHIAGEFRSVQTLRLSLQRGITTVCSVSANLDGLRLRAAIEAGQLRGCARLIAGGIVTPTHGHVKGRTADGPWEVRKAVREMTEAGSDFIKTAASGGFWAANEGCSSPNYTLEELQALTEEAHAWGVPVAVHVHTQPGLKNCLAVGADMVHHGAFIDEAAVRGLRDRSLYYLPTLTVTGDRNIEAYADQPWQTEEMALAQPVHRAGVRLAHELGVTLCAGSDYPGNPRGWRVGDKFLVELQELVACGLSPHEALLAGTRNNAAAYRKLDDLGTLEPGKRADLIVVSADPLADIGVLYDQSNLALVIKDGLVEYAGDTYRHLYCVSDRPQ